MNLSTLSGYSAEMWRLVEPILVIGRERMKGVAIAPSPSSSAAVALVTAALVHWGAGPVVTLAVPINIGSTARTTCKIRRKNCRNCIIINCIR